MDETGDRYSHRVYRFLKMDKSFLVTAEKEINLERDLMSFAAIDTHNDKIPELLVAGYPQDFLILAKEQKDQPDKNE